MESIKGNDDAIRNFGIDNAYKLCKDLFDSGIVHGIHFYTLNREVAVKEILNRLGLWATSSDSDGIRYLPWKQCVNYQRQGENVRPIFWASRPRSYIYRTENWDQFPNGRWGNSSAPSFGELKDYHLFYLNKPHTKEQLLKQWGYELESERDVWEIFEAFISGNKNKHGFKVKDFPWCEEEISKETEIIEENLRYFNKKGILTINSQPNVNGLQSNDPVFGWGYPNGYVYQKAYLEFFTSINNLPYLQEALKEFPNINYHIISKTVSIL